MQITGQMPLHMQDTRQEFIVLYIVRPTVYEVFAVFRRKLEPCQARLSRTPRYLELKY